MGLHVKVIHITAEDSPNVQLGLYQRRAGLEPTFEDLVPGVVSFREYLTRRATWDKIKQCVGLDGRFYVGAEVLLYPPDWVHRANGLAESLRQSRRVRKGRAMGVDPAEGGDNTSATVVDEWGVLEQESSKTPDTSRIIGNVIQLGRRWQVPPEDWVFDRGGGGKQLADQLKSLGYPVRTVGFGEAPAGQPRRTPRRFDEQVDHVEQRQAFANRRAEMYGDLREWLNPTTVTPPGWARATRPREDQGEYAPAVTVPQFHGWGVPAELTELLFQMSKIPLTYDKEGRLYVLPKSKKNKDSRERTLIDLIGHSPDELDSLVLAHHGMTARPERPTMGFA